MDHTGLVRNAEIEKTNPIILKELSHQINGHKSLRIEIVSLCLIRSVQESDVVLSMLEEIRHIVEEGPIYNWVEHVKNIFKGEL
jgi:hypothetical protein